jgi:hypothetical protein
MQVGEEKELQARIFSETGRAELWSAGNGTGDSHNQ